MEKLNIAEILKDYSNGTKLYSLVHGEVELKGIYKDMIRCKPNYLNNLIDFYFDGRWVENKGECILFPSKENRDWSKFQRPFKDGDIAISDRGDIHLLRTADSSYCSYRKNFRNPFDKTITTKVIIDRLATEEEKQKLFDAIKANGYKWNAETKTLEKLKVNKFDITTLKPFDKVLIRQCDFGKWEIDFFGYYDKGYHTTGRCIYRQCVPYEGNQHLLGTTNDCDEYYKTWE